MQNTWTVLMADIFAWHLLRDRLTMAGACNVEYNALKTAKPVHPFRESKPRPKEAIAACRCLGPTGSRKVWVTVLSRILVEQYPQTTSTWYRYNLKPAQFETGTICTGTIWNRHNLKTAQFENGKIWNRHNLIPAQFDTGTIWKRQNM